MSAEMTDSQRTYGGWQQEKVAFLFGPRFNLSFGGPTVLPSVSPELGVQYGF